jgi:micrococcal nuclease
VLHKDTTFVPLRFVSEALGAKVTWTEATKAIDIEPQVEPAPPPGAEKVIVKRVVGGGTVELEDGRQVRLIGVDTPDTLAPGKPVQRYGPEASEFIKAHLAGSTIYLEYDLEKQDLLGRTLAYIWLEDGQLFNEILVREGYAQIMTASPNVRYADRFRTLQADAREQQRGF